MDQASEHLSHSISTPDIARKAVDAFHPSRETDPILCWSFLQGTDYQEDHQESVQCLESGDPDAVIGYNTSTNQTRDPFTSCTTYFTSPTLIGTSLQKTQSLVSEVGQNHSVISMEPAINPAPAEDINRPEGSTDKKALRPLLESFWTSSYSTHPLLADPIYAGTGSFVFFNERNGIQEPRGPNHSTGGTGAGPSLGVDTALQQSNTRLVYHSPPAHASASSHHVATVRPEARIIQNHTISAAHQNTYATGRTRFGPRTRPDMVNAPQFLPTPFVSGMKHGTETPIGLTMSPKIPSRQGAPSSSIPVITGNNYNVFTGCRTLPIGNETVKAGKDEPSNQSGDVFAMIEKRRQAILRDMRESSVYRPEPIETSRSSTFVSSHPTSKDRGLKRGRQDEQDAQIGEKMDNSPKKRRRIA